MSSAWGLSWSRAWGNSWGLFAKPSIGGGGGAGWVLQQFVKRPWELTKLDKKRIVREAYKDLLAAEVDGVSKLVAPYKSVHGIDWAAVVRDTTVAIDILLRDVRLKNKLDEDAAEEEALIWLMAY